ncbi:HET domain protein [Apiospora arundinis]|uniref:HET domain protein n=1 Tax=Apiospora arundinis TaxID=335852 RepID=A0ABR2HPQ9_9PEZI
MDLRLLKTDQYKLVENVDLPAPVPEYAILSHTWISPQEEITYQDFQQRKRDIDTGIYKQKGWAKLRQYCDRAARDGWEWAWMDTCCIDKTNGVDTSKAINAMFRYYQNAAQCYAYLDDVDTDKVLSRTGFEECDLDDVPGENNVADPTTFSHKALKSFLVKAKWFTRGWTLQELLAPPDLVFLDQAWRRIGTRECWSQAIKEACKIDAQHLSNFSPTDYTSCSIAMRFSWASQRETTVEEDETYSLIGLFGVSLSLTYGEGRWKAFNRLQEALINAYDDDSIFAWLFGKTTKGLLSGSQQEVMASSNGQRRGILAPSIREYRDASHIVTFGLNDSSFSMTNRGIEFNARRWRYRKDSSRRLILLNCGPENTATHLGDMSRFAIPLRHVVDTIERFELDEIYDATMTRPDEWVEEFKKGPTVVPANNYSEKVATSSVIFSLKYPEQITIGKKYFVNFDSLLGNTPLTLLDESWPRHDLAEDELIVKPNRLVFINIELESGFGNPPEQFDVIVNLSEKGTHSFGILARAEESLKRLRNPLEHEESGNMYKGLAHHLHYGTAPYPVKAFDESKDTEVGVSIRRQTAQQRLLHGTADPMHSATLRKYTITIRVNCDHDQLAPTHSSKRRRLA